MGIKVYATPQRRDGDKLEYAVDGENIIINGVEYDLSEVSGKEDVESDYVCGPIFRQDGDIHVCLIVPYEEGETPCEKEEMPIYEGDIPEPVTIVYAVDLWSRMTDDEADQVTAEMATQPVRTRMIFQSANSYRSDHELWLLLTQIATNLFGEERAAQILAPS